MIAHCGLALILLASAAPYRAKVIGVTDGDTIEVLRGRSAVKIRLHGVDAPERGQPFADRAHRRVADLVFGETVTVKPLGVDRYGRTLAVVFLPSGENINEKLVGEGLAWWFRRYAPRERRLEDIEERARDGRIGLWTDPDPEPPWLWRRARKK